MAFKLGQEKPEGSGRTKGTPNKKTVAKVSEYLGERGINPAEEILKIINEKDIKKLEDGSEIDLGYVLGSSVRADLWLELLSFCHAKPKTIEFKQSEPDFDATEFNSVATEDLMKVIGKSQSSGTA